MIIPLKENNLCWSNHTQTHTKLYSYIYCVVLRDHREPPLYDMSNQLTLNASEHDMLLVWSICFRSSSLSTNQSYVLVIMQSFTSTPALKKCKSQWVTAVPTQYLTWYEYIYNWSVVKLSALWPQALICLVDKKSGEKSKTRPRFVKQDQVCIARLRAAGVICLETFKDFPQMGRFTLRDEGKYSLLNFCTCLVYFFSDTNTSFHINRQNYRHWQSTEAGARKGLNATRAACMEFFHSLPEEKRC